MDVEVGGRSLEGAADFIFDAQRELIENPAPSMQVPSWQAPVAIVARLDDHGRRRGRDAAKFDMGPARDSEAGPYLGGVLPVNDDRVVGSRAALSLPFRDPCRTGKSRN